jgi:transposase
MTYIRKIKKKNGTYLAEVEGKWINGKSVQRHIRYIGVVPKINEKITSKSDRKRIRDLDIIQKLLDGKSKEDLSILYEVTTKTIDNIKKRFDKDGVNGLIHTRKNNIETVKVSTPEQAAIITDVVQHPNKSAKEIKYTTGTDTPISVIKKLISPILNHLKSKKKILLEIK